MLCSFWQLSFGIWILDKINQIYEYKLKFKVKRLRLIVTLALFTYNKNYLD